VRTAILISGHNVVLALQPQTDVERRAVDLVTSERSEVTVHRDQWAGEVGGTYRSFQGLGGELVVVARARTEDPTPTSENTRPRTTDDLEPPLPEHPPRHLVWNFASKFEYMTALQASARLDVVMGLLAEKLRAQDPPPRVELAADSAPMLQLRRDVVWLRDRGVVGQTSLLSHTLAEMVGLEVLEFESLTLRTRQKFENRAYTALRTLNGGAR
jgi:hypothetical protein